MIKTKLIVVLGLLIGVFLWFRSCDSLRTYNLEDLTSNFDQNEKEIKELIKYFDSIIPDDTQIDIEINNLNEVDIFHIKQNEIYNNHWNVNLKSKLADSILTTLNWDLSHIQKIKLLLDEANCISIENFNYHTIGFKRSLMSKFSYVVYDEKLNEPQIRDFDEKCTHIFYRDNVVLEYGSGATGSICFPDRFKQ